MEYELGDKILYEYYVTIDGKEYKADKCYEQSLGVFDSVSVCYVDNVIYTNVTYREVIVGLDKGYYNFYFYIGIGICCMFWLLLIIFSIVGCVKDKKWEKQYKKSV